MKNVLLLVPTETYRAQAFVDAAARLDIAVTIASEDLLPMAHRMDGRAIVVSLENPDIGASQIQEAHKARPFDAVVSIDDTGLRTAALASEKLGLKHISTSTTDLAQNKIAMRKRLSGATVLQPKFQTYDDSESLEEKLSLVGTMPVVIKPATLSGSIGVMRANSLAEVREKIPLVRSIQALHGCDSSQPLLIEEYVNGNEHAVEAIVIAGQLQLLAIFDKPQPLLGPFFAETIYVTPTSLPHKSIDALFAALDTARIELGITTGPIHAEFRIADSGDIYFIELAARSIGGTCSKAVPLSAGRSIEELILAEAAGISPPELSFENQASGVYMIPVPRKGTLKLIAGIDEARAVKWVTGVDMTYSENTEVFPIPYDAKYLGFVFAKAPTTKAVVRALEEAVQKLKMEII